MGDVGGKGDEVGVGSRDFGVNGRSLIFIKGIGNLSEGFY